MNRTLIGCGNTAEIYALEENLVLKLFREGIGRHLAMQEYQTSVYVQERLRNVPKAHSFVEQDDRFGIVYDRITGINLLEEMMHSDHPQELARSFARLQIEFHHCHVFCGPLPSVKSKLRGDMMSVSELSSSQKQQLDAVLQSLPDGASLCHFDFHPGNVMMQGSTPVLIDWMTACYGDSCADAARTLLLLQHGEQTEETASPLDASLRKCLADAYLQEYCLCSHRKEEDIRRWLLPVAAARLHEWLTASEKQALLSIVAKGLPG